MPLMMGKKNEQAALLQKVLHADDQDAEEERGGEDRHGVSGVENDPT